MLNFLLDSFALGLKNLRLHKLRSLLTTLGIIIGVAAFISMVAIGQGTKKAALDQLQQLGARNILVRSVRPPESSDATGKTQRMLNYGLKYDDLDRLRSLPDLEKVVPLRDTEQRVTRGDVRVNANAIGTTPDIFHVINLRLAEGRLFDWLDHDGGAMVCVIGHMAARQLFPYEQPVGQTIRVGTYGSGTARLTVVGVLEPTGLRAGSEGAAIMGRDLDFDVYFPLPVARQMFGDSIVRRQAGSIEWKKVELTEVWLQARAMTDVETLARLAETQTSLGARAGRGHGGGGGGASDAPKRLDVEIKAPIQILRNAERLNHIFNVIIVGIASFSLIVGGIGIMNIMLATVTERTREIGIRRALGAKRWHIMLQFLVETTVISLTGGLIGIGLGIGLAIGLPLLAHWISGGKGDFPTDVAPLSVLISVAVSAVIGVIAGLYPAILAAFMNPIEALRHE